MSTSASLFDLTGRTALVTGAGFGLGRAFARALAAHGAEVVAADIDFATAEQTSQLIVQEGGKSSPLQVDVADERSVAALAAATSQVDILVNNAGVASLVKRVHEMTTEEWNRVIGIDLTGVFFVTRAILPKMLAQGRGSIVNIASIAGLTGFPHLGSPYSAAKAGVAGFTRQLAVEYAKDNIRANAIAPGWHGGTNLGQRTKSGMSAERIEEFEATIRAGTPMGRRGTPEELGGLCVYLASDASSFVTGQVIAHDGGWTSI
jgi:NAD(P)-dependent dehydrogenase (short-subunit alcohol dehydrogenase family)